MSIYSPFYNASDPDTKYLNGVSKWLYPFTCRCRSKHGWTYDTARGMWVCPTCRLPSGFAADNPESKLVKECIDCGDYFVIWNALMPEYNCKNCGGENVALPGQRTPDPMKEESYD